MADSQSHSKTFTSEPEIDASQEVRFAVVMYGGVSLAIYISGVAQELLRLVQSTAPLEQQGDTVKARPLPPAPGDAAGTTWTYRKLAYLLSNDELRESYREQLKQHEGKELPLPGEDLLEQAMASNASLGLRFVVDILSGTSAGGINALFLAKALANNQDMEQIKKLWVSEAEMSRLLNDSQSIVGLGLPLNEPQESLLNSQRMYVKLLQALEGMDRPSSGDKAGLRPPLVEDLDLFITVTDLAGLPQPLRLSDRLVYERRHRNVFHFKYENTGDQGAGSSAQGANDFVPQNNPFLAFAARCTSAFPFAFEPMCLNDIDAVRKAPKDEWRRFFGEHMDPMTGEPIPFEQRAFADGGYLDNKPFSYATEAMLHRSQDRLMVDRKLLYIEPNPEHPEDVQQATGKPNALANVKAATLDLPSYETIREDLELVLQRNRLIWRVNGLVGDIERDVELYEHKHRHRARAKVEVGTHDQDLADMIQEYGVSFLPYRRLRVSSVTDELARLVARITGLGEQSDYWVAIRYLIRDWRRRTYRDQGEDDRSKPALGQFLKEFDFSYRLRRLLFLRHKLDEMQRESVKAAKPTGKASQESLAALQKRLGPVLGAQPNVRESISAEDLVTLTPSIQELKQSVDKLYMKLRRYERALRKPPGSSDGDAEIAAHVKPVHAAIETLGIDRKHLEYILGVPWESTFGSDGAGNHMLGFAGHDEDGHRKRIAELFTVKKYGVVGLQDRLDALGNALRLCLMKILDDNRTQMKALFDGSTEPGRSDAVLPDREPHRGRELESALRGYLQESFEHFEHYDQIRFPILYETDVGEADAVDVIRISPEDATSLIDERKELEKLEARLSQSRKPARGKPAGEKPAGGKPAGEKPRRKLAGTALRNFGAFLKEGWRQNDMMWGRLDGAERLITALLPGSDDALIRKALIEEAQVAILHEDLPDDERTVDRIMARIQSGVAEGKSIQQVLEQVTQEAARSTRPGHELLDYMRFEYKVDGDLDREAMLRLVSRSTQVIGKMFERMAKDNELGRSGVVWVARIGQALWGLIEVAAPQSILNVVVRHWFKLLYVFECVVILGAWLLADRNWTYFGWITLGITGGAHLVVLLLRDFMQRRKLRWSRVIPVILVLVTLFFAGIGLHRMSTVGAAEAVREVLPPVLGGDGPGAEDEHGPDDGPDAPTSLPRR